MLFFFTTLPMSNYRYKDLRKIYIYKTISCLGSGPSEGDNVALVVLAFYSSTWEPFDFEPICLMKSKMGLCG